MLITLKFLVGLCLVLTLTVIGTNSMDILFEYRAQYEVSRGVTYERNRMMTTDGMLDVHVLIIDLSQPYISVAPVSSAHELGLRETTSNMLRDAGALAGINADFFGTAGWNSVHFGPVAADGSLLAVNPNTNSARDEFAAFFLDTAGNPFFAYMRSTVRFYNNWRNNIAISAYNTVGPALDWPVIISQSAMLDTYSLTSRFEGLTKIVVSGGQIVQVTQPGATVIVPSNGFVVVLPARMATYRRYFNVGEPAHMSVTNDLGIDFANIQAAIGGGAVVLAGGETVYNRGVAPNARHPRSAIAATQCGQYLILLAIDGRSHSVGATHTELATILRMYGAYDAMHFDGGGSTTIVSSTRGQDMHVANIPADGAQRRVINALGVFDNSTMGAPVGLGVQVYGQAVQGIGVNIGVFLHDIFGNRIDAEGATISIVEGEASVYANIVTPKQAGVLIIEARHASTGMVTTHAVYVFALAELYLQISSANLFEGQHASLSFSALSQCGANIAVTQVQELGVWPANLGHFEGSNFIATSGGNGYIYASIGDVQAFLPISVIGFGAGIPMPVWQIGQLAHPSYGNVAVTTETVLGMQLIRMDYEFMPRSTTQAAYVVFDPPLAISYGATALRLQVLGDGSGHWLRARIRDAAGQVHLIDFASHVDFIGWETVIATLPANAVGPLTIDQIYMVSLNVEYASRHLVFFYQLESLHPSQTTVDVPLGTQFIDRMQATAGFNGAPGMRLHEFVVPTTATSLVPVIWGGFHAFNMTAADGGLASTNAAQWQVLQYIANQSHTAPLLILLDTPPHAFAQSMEYELFHLALRSAAANGRDVFVVSASGNHTMVRLRDGVRYITIPAPDIGIATIRFWVSSSGEILWG